MQCVSWCFVDGSQGRSRGLLAATVHMEIKALWAAPLQGRTLDSSFAVVVGRRIVEPRSLSMIGIDTLAHTHTLSLSLCSSISVSLFLTRACSLCRSLALLCPSTDHFCDQWCRSCLRTTTDHQFVAHFVQFMGDLVQTPDQALASVDLVTPLSVCEEVSRALLQRRDFYRLMASDSAFHELLQSVFVRCIRWLRQRPDAVGPPWVQPRAPHGAPRLPLGIFQGLRAFAANPLTHVPLGEAVLQDVILPFLGPGADCTTSDGGVCLPVSPPSAPHRWATSSFARGGAGDVYGQEAPVTEQYYW